jgi:arabinofuranosyltransferase
LKILGKKAKKKIPVQQKEKESGKKSGPIYYEHFQDKFKAFQFFPVYIVFAAVIYFLYASFKANGYFCFPLDDPWIHLTFAKNLVNYGSFSYFKNELATSGSTSPVYTLLAALLYLFFKNEFLISYFLGISFGMLLVYLTLKLSKKLIPAEPEESSRPVQLLAAAAALFVALEPKLNLINVSGMETSMFISFIAAGLYAYQKKKMILLGIFLGLAVWCRPDGLVLWAAVIFDYFIQKYLFKKKNGRRISTPTDENPKKIITALSAALIFLASYFVFNYFLSGSILPNTYSAKLEYYHSNDRGAFLENEVVKYFTQFEFSLFWVPFLIGVVGILRSLFKKEKSGLLVFLLFILGLIGVYYIKLPFAHRFGRYLMPVIPFYIIIAVSGVKIFFDFISVKFKSAGLSNFLFIIYLVSACAVLINQNIKETEEYTFYCKYHNERHVAAGKWLKANTNENAVIATHDIGAIAFYSERKIIDMTGLITPELINQINKPLYSDYLNKYLSSHKTDYLVTLRNWFEVVNDKPVFIPVNAVEFLEVFKYDPLRTHIQPKTVSFLNNSAIQMLQNGNIQNGIAYLNQSLKLDSRSSRTYFLLGAVYEMLKDYLNAEQNFSQAVKLFPEYAEAYFGLAKVSFDQHKMEETKRYLDKCLGINPDYTPAIQLKNNLDSSF